MDYILGELSSSATQREALWEVAKREALQDEAQMQNAQKQLKFLMAGGSWPNMVARITALLEKKAISVHFIVLLKINTQVAQQRGWKNKVVVFEKLEEFINNFSQKTPEQRAQEEEEKKRQEAEAEADRQTARGGGFGMHAPVFESNLTMDATDNAAAEASAEVSTVTSLIVDEKLDATQTHPSGCVDGKFVSMHLLGISKPAPKAKRKSGAKKKSRKTDRKKMKPVIDRVGQALNSNGWAVCDNFVTTDTVHKLRAEINTLEPHFEPSEIWVGKGSASVGAHLRVPNVRGDKVEFNILIEIFFCFFVVVVM